MKVETIKTIWDDGELKHNTYVVIGDCACIVIDAGASLEEVKKVSDKPIEAVFITHGHFDHTRFIEEYDSLNVPIYMNEKTMQFLGDSILNASSLFRLNFNYEVKNAKFIKDDDTIKVAGMKVDCIYTPGHTSDSMSFLVENTELFSGDCLFSIAVGRTDLATGNMATLVDSIQKLNNINYKNLYAGHGRESDKEEQKTNIPRWVKELQKIMNKNQAITIEKYNKNDNREVYNFIKIAFETAEVADGNEQDFFERIANSSRFIPELTMVARENSQIIGFIMLCYTDLVVNDKIYKVLNLGPVAVKFEKRNKMIGSKLINAVIDEAKEMQENAIFLAGNPKFYSRFGFEPTINYGIKCNVPLPEEMYQNIMCLELNNGYLKDKKGIVDLILKDIK